MQFNRSPHRGAVAAIGGRAWRVEAHQRTSYRVEVFDDLFGNRYDPDIYRRLGLVDESARRLVFMDSDVHALHGTRIAEFFDEHGTSAHMHPIGIDESVKHWDTTAAVLDSMTDFGLDRRREPVIAIGGGVLTDVVGFAASIFRRGTPHIRIPTTLLGLVDAGIGVKTGINYRRHKNRLGSYAPPELALLDRTFLATLPPRHLSNGMAEILKIALVRSAPLFRMLESDGHAVVADRFRGSTPQLDAAARDIVDDAVEKMLDELAPNLWEHDLERCVDYGHSFGPLLEMAALPDILHGEAVSIDMALSAALAFRRGYLRHAELSRIFRTTRSLGLPLWNDVLLEPGILADALRETTRHRGGRQRLPLLRGIGKHCFVDDVTSDELRAALDFLADTTDSDHLTVLESRR